jgi:hypothetical protein
VRIRFLLATSTSTLVAEGFIKFKNREIMEGLIIRNHGNTRIPRPSIALRTTTLTSRTHISRFGVPDCAAMHPSGKHTTGSTSSNPDLSPVPKNMQIRMQIRDSRRPRTLLSAYCSQRSTSCRYGISSHNHTPTSLSFSFQSLCGTVDWNKASSY